MRATSSPLPKDGTPPAPPANSASSAVGARSGRHRRRDDGCYPRTISAIGISICLIGASCDCRTTLRIDRSGLTTRGSPNKIVPTIVRWSRACWTVARLRQSAFLWIEKPGLDFGNRESRSDRFPSSRLDCPRSNLAIDWFLLALVRWRHYSQ